MLITELPRESRVARIQNPAVAWNPEAHLLAAAVDVLQAANWQRSGGKGTRPRPIPRPGKQDGRKRLGTARPLHEARDLLDRWRRGELHATHTSRSQIHTRKGEVTHGRN